MVIPVVDERAHVTKREVATDRVRVRTMVDTREELVSDTLQHEAIEVDRRAVERRVEAQPAPREEGDATILSLCEERLIVTRALYVVEEVVIRRSTHSERVEAPVTLRTTRAVVERSSPGNEQEQI